MGKKQTGWNTKIEFVENKGHAQAGEQKKNGKKIGNRRKFLEKFKTKFSVFVVFVILY
jgi:hypothetical protein